MKSTGQQRSVTRNADGFSIIEVMIALGILSIGILAVAAMQIEAFKGNRSARLRTEAVTVASEKLEELGSNYDHADLANGAHAETQGEFALSWNVAEDSPITGTKTIAMSVGWNGGDDVVNIDYIIADLD